MHVTSVSQPSSCVFASRKRPRLSSRQARWLSPVLSRKTILASPRASTRVSFRSLASTPNSPSSKSRTSWEVATFGSPFAWRDWLTATDSSAVMNLRLVYQLFFSRALLSVVQLFPGLIYRMIKPKVVLLIFVSGKIVLTGAKVIIDISNCFLFHYKRARANSSSLRRSEKRFTLRSILSIRCCVNSASRDR